eukprot:TRINITY_DN105873_c0_g1_i1.p1 TRINITY_DN105873_c0_g1~~TRINITY_DN105873_c0_g1_i1.p1  ORF type:complete len:299 (+),score=49.74 TRINITY_DN105873_c0_g1_i1:39-935(+)
MVGTTAPDRKKLRLAGLAGLVVLAGSGRRACLSNPAFVTPVDPSLSMLMPRRPCHGMRVSTMRTRLPRAAGVAEKELDSEALGKYAAALGAQLSAITAFLATLDAMVGAALPDWSVFALFFGMSIRSRIFSPLDNSRPDATKAARGEASGGFGDRVMPSWTPPGVFFPIMWIIIVAPLRAASSVLIWQQVGHLCDVSILALMLHLCVGDTWNTINNVERRLGAAVPGVLCVWASALLAAYSYYQVRPEAGQLLLPMCLWITVAAALVTDTWRVNNASGDEPLYPYRGQAQTRFWFSAE